MLYKGKCLIKGLLFFLLLFLLFFFLLFSSSRSVTASLILVIRRVGLSRLLTRPLTEPLGKLGCNYSV